MRSGEKNKTEGRRRMKSEGLKRKEGLKTEEGEKRVTGEEEKVKRRKR